MLVKAGVDISRLNREIRRALAAAERIDWIGGDELVVTSTYDGNHSAGSLHYANDAVDIRLPKSQILEYLAELKQALGRDYDVVLEKDHIHIEYDPKGERKRR